MLEPAAVVVALVGVRFRAPLPACAPEDEDQHTHGGDEKEERAQMATMMSARLLT